MSRVIGIFGSDSGVGTTMIAQSIGESLGKRNLKTLVIMAGGKYGDDYFKNKERKSLDSIKANLINGVIEYPDVEQIIVQSGDISILPGLKNVYTAGYYPKNSLEQIISSVGETFEFLVIDGGDNMNLGLTISALKASKERFFVLTQQEKSMRRFLYMKEKVLDPLKVSGQLIVNKHMNQIALLSSKEIGKALGFAYGGKAYNVPYIEEGWQGELKQKTLMNYPRFARSIEEISRSLLGEEKERKWIKNLVWKNI